MKIYFSILFLFLSITLSAQSPTQQIVEGSKTLVELIKVIKTPRQNLNAQKYKGGLARAKKLTPERRKEIAKMGAKARFGKK